MRADKPGDGWARRAGAMSVALALAGCTDPRRDGPTPASGVRQGTVAASAPLVASMPAPEVAASPPPAPELVASSPALLVPVAGVRAEELHDNYDQVRGEGRHEALDILAPRGTPVLAVADGHVAKLFLSKPGGLTIYQFDTTSRLAYYYAHLDSYAPGLVEGMPLRRGQLIGSVGSTGNASADAPHLHFAVFVLGPERQWWKGTPVNPYPLFTGR